jgi:hypothetical protein
MSSYSVILWFCGHVSEFKAFLGFYYLLEILGNFLESDLKKENLIAWLHTLRKIPNKNFVVSQTETTPKNPKRLQNLVRLKKNVKKVFLIE